MKKQILSKFTNVLALSAVTLGFGIALATSNTVLAADPTGWQAGNIIDDAIYTDRSSMSVSDIQAFLNSKVPSCDTWGTGTSPYWAPDYNSDGRISRAEYGQYRGNPAPFTCLKDYREVPKTTPGGGVPSNNYGAVSGNNPSGSLSAAEIIWYAAQDFNISPKVLLVTLQKESGLITDDWTFKSQLVYAMGAHCPDTGPGGSANCDPNYGGFSLQIRESADLMRYYLDNMQQPWWSNKRPYQNNFIQYDVETSCGGSNVYMENKATTALYVYTPYQPSQAALNAGYGSAEPCGAYGNRNFWLYFNDWFGPTRGTFLIQSPASPAVYLQSGPNRYGIPSWDVIRAYGFDNVKVTPVSDQYMNSLTDGGVLSTTFKKEGSDAVYFVDNGHRFGFATYQQCVNWGFPNCLNSSSKSITSSIFNRLHDAGAMKSLMLTGSTVFLMQDGEKRPILSGKAMNDLGFTNSDIVPVTNSSNNSQPVGFAVLENSSFIKFSPQATIFYFNNSKFYALTYQSFLTLASGKTVFNDNYSKYTLASPTAEYVVSQFIRTQDGKSYAFTNGKKLDISATTADWPSQQITPGIDSVINAQPSVTVTQESTFRSNSGAIFDVIGNQIRPFYSLYDYLAQHNNPIGVGNEILDTITTGEYLLTPGAGSVYQVTTAGKEYALYTLNKDGTPCQITSMNQLGIYGFNTSAVKRVPEPAGATTPLTRLAWDESEKLYSIDEGGKTYLPANILASTWGINTNVGGCKFSTATLNKIKMSQTTFSKFMRAENGVIFYGEAGKKRPIYTYNAFLRLGGNGSNTPTVTDSLLNLSPNGDPITQ